MTVDYRLVAALSCAGLLILALALFVLLVAVKPAWSERRALRLRARQDYLNARGTAHRQVLAEALKQTESKAAACEQRLTKARSLKAASESQLDSELDAAVSKWIIAQHLRDIRGVGPKLQHDIASTVFRGRLTDLHRAHKSEE